MVKRLKAAAAFLFMAVVLMACSHSNSEQSEAESLAKEFVGKLYAVKHESIPEIDLPAIEEKNKEIQPYVTENVWNKLKANSDTAIPIRIAKKSRSNVGAELQKVTIEPTKEVEHSYDLTYDIMVKVTNENNEVKEYKVPGEATVIKEKDKWAINRIWSDPRELSVYFN